MTQRRPGRLRASGGIPLSHPLRTLASHTTTNIEAVLRVMRGFPTIEALHSQWVVTMLADLAVTLLSHICKFGAWTRRRGGCGNMLRFSKDMHTDLLRGDNDGGFLSSTGRDGSQCYLHEHAPGACLWDAKQQLIHSIGITVGYPGSSELFACPIKLPKVTFRVGHVSQAQG